MAGSDKQNLGSGSSLEDSMERIKLLNEGSTLITEGPPERRLLNTSKQEIDEKGNIRRWTLGVKNPQKMMKTIVLMGEKGTGKSTFINVMTNYILGVEWSDKIIYEIVEEEKHQSESQTSKVTVYEIFGYENDRVPFSLRIIDTPGYGDTSGETVDKRMVQDLRYLFQCEDGVDQINAVGLVVRASQNRLTPNQRCIFDAVLSLFGKNLKKNMIPVITFSRACKPAALAILDKFGFSWSRDEKNNLLHFQFDNDPEEDEEDTSPDYFREAWEKRKKTMETFFKYLINLKTRSLEMTHDVLFKREELVCCVQSLQKQMAQVEDLQNEIRQIQEAVEEYKGEIEEMRKCDVQESFADKVESDMWATSCEKCKFTCHYPCNIFHDVVLWCPVSQFKNCISCPGKCSLSDHVTEKMRYVPSVTKMTRTFKELKEKYEKLSRGLERVQKTHLEELRKTANQKLRLILESYNYIIRLNEIALRPESLSILPNLNFLIEKLRETNQSDKAQKLENIRKWTMKAHNIEGEEQSLLMNHLTSFYS